MSADTEKTITVAAQLVARHPDKAERVLRFIYQLGFMEGGLDMAKVNSKIHEEIRSEA